MRCALLVILFTLVTLSPAQASPGQPSACSQFTGGGAPLPLGKLLADGEAALGAALRAVEPLAEPLDDLLIAKACYERALLQSPDSYEASLGLGVVHLMRAKHLLKRRQDAVDVLSAAKHHIGRAYFLRQDPYEPLYYLAEVALLQRDFAQAESFLQPLQEARWKEGAVYLLLGELVGRGAHPWVRGCERAKHLSHCCYQRALEAGGPPAAYRYASYRLGRFREGPLSVALKLGPVVPLHGPTRGVASSANPVVIPSTDGVGSVLGIELGRTLNDSRNVSLLLPLQLHLQPAQYDGLADKMNYRMLLLAGIQYDLVWPLHGFTFYGRLSAGLSLEWKWHAELDLVKRELSWQAGPDLTKFFVFLPEIGVRYSPNGRNHIGLDLLSFPLFVTDSNEKFFVNYQALIYAGSHF